MKTKFMQAFEEIEETPVAPVVVEPEAEVIIDEVSPMMVEQEENASDIAVMQDQVEEAQETQEVLEKIEAAATSEEALCIAKEHLLNRIGYSTEVSMESFKASDEVFKDKLGKSFEIAQEGIFQRMGSAIQFAFTTEDSMSKQTTQVAKALETKGSKEDKISEPGWGRILTVTAKTELNVSDVEKTLGDYEKLVKGSEFKKMISGITAILKSLSAEVGKSRFIADDAATKEIIEINKVADNLTTDLSTILNIGAKRKVDSTFTPVTPEEGKKLMKTVYGILNDSSVDNVYKDLSIAINKTDMTLFAESLTRLAGVNAKDIRAARMVITSINPALSALNEIIRNRSKVCFSAIQYVKASTK